MPMVMLQARDARDDRDAKGLRAGRDAGLSDPGAIVVYHLACIKGTDADQACNFAKPETVE